jgi:adenylate kinase
MYIVLIGAPGAGKGTQAVTMAEDLQLAHVASGDMFRAAVQRGTPTGLQAKAFMDRGELVPDDVTVAMVMERLREPDASKGVILDGFPRTVAQAEALSASLTSAGQKVDQAIYLAVDDGELLRRLSGRWLCRSCGASYHEVFNPPQQAGRCDRCGGELYQRDDDTVETAKRRLQVYFDQTMPIIDFYRREGVLDEVDGAQSIDDVRQAIVNAVRQRRS